MEDKEEEEEAARKLQMDPAAPANAGGGGEGEGEDEDEDGGGDEDKQQQNANTNNNNNSSSSKSNSDPAQEAGGGGGKRKMHLDRRAKKKLRKIFEKGKGTRQQIHELLGLDVSIGCVGALRETMSMGSTMGMSMGIILMINMTITLTNNYPDSLPDSPPPLDYCAPGPRRSPQPAQSGWLREPVCRPGLCPVGIRRDQSSSVVPPKESPPARKCGPSVRAWRLQVYVRQGQAQDGQLSAAL